MMVGRHGRLTLSFALTMAVACADPSAEDNGENFPTQESIIDDLFGEGAAAGEEATTSTFPSVDSFDGPGPFWTTSHAGGWNCSVWRPLTLGEEGRKHPVIIWGNGTFNTPDFYTFLFDHWASHGFIVVAANTSDAGSGLEMVDCMNWVEAENNAFGALGGHADVNKMGVAGYSQGGCGALMAGQDPRVKATAPISPFIVLPLGFCDATSIFTQHAPMFLISGTLDLVAESTLNQAPIFAGAPVPVVWANHVATEHLEVLLDGGAYQGPLTAWFRYTLMNDPKAKRVFAVDTCELCNDWNWTVSHNLLWSE